ncbi:MAG: uracil phosphoribosyltransferase [Rhodothermales bacterium]|nr:uracil phosphoribosyltransferase [Rhodothermales bacterium]MBO6780779.1 uracil phosphoribosyltransferase [Rhodothermales bacterium]
MGAPKVTVIDHPIVRRDLTILRRQETTHGTFRATLSNISGHLAYEALRDMPESEVTIETPLEQTVGHTLRGSVIVVPILRAGLGLVDGVLRLIPDARVGHLGMYRNEETREPVSYYERTPRFIERARVLVVDPMLATGGSAVGAIDVLKRRGARDIRFICLVAAPEGVTRLNEAHPDVPIITAALDRQLDGNAYIRPGLGDAGDRIFGTQD